MLDVLSGIQPSGELHLGNYFGAIANWVKLQEQYNCAYGVVDLHAMTLPYDPAELRSATQRMVLDLLACGIDPNKSLMFVQSLVPEHTELCWILSTVCAFGKLTTMVQFKEKTEFVSETDTEGFVSAALCFYPILQAADILIYRAKYVPVGKDQEQHLELSRDVARRFNNRFGEYFNEPQPLFTATPKIMSPADPDKKMSKSLGPGHYIGLFEDPKSIAKKIRSAVTDTGTPPEGKYMSAGVENLFLLLRAAGATAKADELESEYRKGNRRYAPLKDAVIQALTAVVEPLRARRAALERDADTVWQQVEHSSRRARELAGRTLDDVRKLVGLPNRQ
ncbi:MAG TPA: tryptophan--tRNA ligase [Phycisphaerae bacterium]|jgi:tryptophanyl-tRNA synthetase